MTFAMKFKTNRNRKIYTIVRGISWIPVLMLVLLCIAFFPDDSSLSDLLSLNIFETPSLVQFIHRNIAYLITLYTVIILIYVLYKRKTYLYNAAFLLVFMIFFQVLLGILTLTSGVNIVFASMHQLSTIFLIIFSINFYYKSFINILC